MRAVLMTAAGGPEVLKLAELPEPEITEDHDVRVRLRAAGINPSTTSSARAERSGERCPPSSAGTGPGSWRGSGQR
jgi:NADPH:quinone reductase-like Zn-dependent oxidoreductase